MEKIVVFYIHRHQVVGASINLKLKKKPTIYDMKTITKFHKSQAVVYFILLQATVNTSNYKNVTIPMRTLVTQE